jgi:hypothetical protein
MSYECYVTNEVFVITTGDHTRHTEKFSEMSWHASATTLPAVRAVRLLIATLCVWQITNVG